jgi:hypothetical protein
LIDGGYLVGDPIDMPGMATFLGQVFEIFSAGGLAPVRVSYEDGTIAEIHIYGIADGREVGESNEATIDVVNECGDGNVRRPCLTTIFNYLPRACWILDHGTLNRADSLFRKTGRHNDGTSAPALLTRSEWQANIGGDNTTILPKPAGQPGNSFYSAFSPGRALRNANFLLISRLNGDALCSRQLRKPISRQWTDARAVPACFAQIGRKRTGRRRTGGARSLPISTAASSPAKAEDPISSLLRKLAPRRVHLMPEGH